MPTPKSAVRSRSVVCLATFILPSRTLPGARQWDAVGQTGDIGRIPAIGKAVHTRGQVRPRCPPTKTPLTWEAYRRSRVTPTHAFLPTVTTRQPQSDRRMRTNPALRKRWGVLGQAGCTALRSGAASSKLPFLSSHLRGYAKGRSRSRQAGRDRECEVVSSPAGAGRPGSRADPPPPSCAQVPRGPGGPDPGESGAWHSPIPARGRGAWPAAACSAAAAAPPRGRRAVRRGAGAAAGEPGGHSAAS